MKAQMLKGSVIMDVTTPEQAHIAEEAGACAGLILLARQEDGRPREGLSTMDIDVCRNAYGRQLGSFQTVGQVKGI